LSISTIRVDVLSDSDELDCGALDDVESVGVDGGVEWWCAGCAVSVRDPLVVAGAVLGVDDGAGWLESDESPVEPEVALAPT
jgi:hypothetical protein